MAPDFDAPLGDFKEYVEGVPMINAAVPFDDNRSTRA
jgi:hypothetical protein